MPRRSRGFLAVLLVILVAFAWSLSMAIHPTSVAAFGAPAVVTAGRETPEPRNGAQAKQPAAPAVSGQANEYVGEETCLAWHETQAYTATRHALKTPPGTSATVIWVMACSPRPCVSIGSRRDGS